MITISLILSILVCLYLYLRIFYLNQPVSDRLNFSLGVLLGFTLSIIPIFSIQMYWKEIFDVFQLNYKLNNWDSFFHQFTNVFLHVGLLEEGTKLMVGLLGIYYFRRNSFLNVQEKASLFFLIFAGVSLGFAFIENIFYGYNYGDLTVIVLRSLISTIVHVLCGVEMGYGLALMFLAPNRLEKIKWVIYSMLVPVTIHTFYDTVIKSIGESSLIIYFIILTTIISYEWVGHRIKKLRDTLKGE